MRPLQTKGPALSCLRYLGYDVLPLKPLLAGR
jgi:hypothetical protein